MKRHVIVMVLTVIALFTVAAGPAFADGAALAETPTNANSYIVQRGDTLSRIARYFGVNLYTLAAVNGIYNLNRVYTGQVLNIAAARGTVPPAYPVDSAPTGSNNYTVQRGDILSRIAQHFGVNLATLASVNSITDYNRLYAGQVLNIAAARPTVPPAFPVNSAPVNASSYTVQRGDNLFRIALHFGVNLTRLASVNGISNSRVIYSGQVLSIAAAR
jgi:LysM repeat protein